MRRDPRYPVLIPCLLEAPGQRPTAGTIVDVSRGGVGLETAGVAPERFTLAFAHDGMAFSLPCAQRHSQDLWGKHRLHVQFGDLDARQQAEVDELVARVSDGQTERRLGALGTTLRRMLRR